MKRAVILYPGFCNINMINEIRRKYDPLADYIAPHITLVFPFDSNISADRLSLHLKEALTGIKKFNVRLKGITGDFKDGYLFLNVKQGNDNIIELHDRLYSGILEDHLTRKISYCPHLTIGRTQTGIEFDKAINELSRFGESFSAVIDRVYVENITDNEKSVPDLSFGLE